MSSAQPPTFTGGLLLIQIITNQQDLVLHGECTVNDAKRYRLRLHCVVPAAGEGLEGPQEAAPQQETEAYQCEWEGGWGVGRTLRLPRLTISSI